MRKAIAIALLSLALAGCGGTTTEQPTDTDQGEQHFLDYVEKCSDPDTGAVRNGTDGCRSFYDG